MNVVLLYLLLAKATLTSFSGLASLPVLRADLVVHYRVLTDHQLNTAVAAGRMGPGPLGNYVVGVGYLVAGVPGAVAGWLAMITPAFLVIPLVVFVGKRAETPEKKARLQAVTRAVILAGAGLLLSAAVPLGRDSIQNLWLAAIAGVSFVLTFLTKVDTLWIVLVAALVNLILSFAI